MSNNKKLFLQCCRMCENYDTEVKCEFIETCPAKQLYEDNKKLEAKYDKLRIEMSWYESPESMGR